MRAVDPGADPGRGNDGLWKARKTIPPFPALSTDLGNRSAIPNEILTIREGSGILPATAAADNRPLNITLGAAASHPKK